MLVNSERSSVDLNGFATLDGLDPDERSAKGADKLSYLSVCSFPFCCRTETHSIHDDADGYFIIEKGAFLCGCCNTSRDVTYIRKSQLCSVRNTAIYQFDLSLLEIVFGMLLLFLNLYVFFLMGLYPFYDPLGRIIIYLDILYLAFLFLKVIRYAILRCRTNTVPISIDAGGGQSVTVLVDKRRLDIICSTLVH